MESISTMLPQARIALRRPSKRQHLMRRTLRQESDRLRPGTRRIIHPVRSTALCTRVCQTKCHCTLGTLPARLALITPRDQASESRARRIYPCTLKLFRASYRFTPPTFRGRPAMLPPTP
jgi:hypothetical protein